MPAGHGEATGMLPAGAAASCSEPLRLPSQAAPVGQQSPQGAESQEEPLGRLRLAPPLGTRSGHGSRGEEGSRVGRQGMAPTGRAAPCSGGWGR